MSLLKLMKLLYLSEREAMARFGHMMSGDRPVSMPHGPVLSQTYDLMNGAGESVPGGWEEWMCDREGHEVALNADREDFGRDQLDELSDGDIQVLDTVWEQFGSMTPWAIRDWTHNHCPEWQDPHGSSTPIQLRRIFAAVGYSGDDAAALEREAEADRRIDHTFLSF